MRTSSKSNNRRRPSRQTRRRKESSELKIWRFRVVQFSLCLGGLILFLRLVQIQVFSHEEYADRARIQYQMHFTKKAARGAIFDRNMNPLALNEPSYDLGFDKRQTGNYASISQKLSKVLGRNSRTILETILKSKNFVYIERQIDDQAAQAIRQLNLRGIKLIPSSRRQYPQKEKLAQVLGFVDIDGRGLSGIEVEYDTYLSGADAASVLQRDAKGQPLMPLQSADDYKNGDDVILTIDHIIQTIVEEELTDAVEQYKAKGGTVIVTNPQNGEILAMASSPGFDANRAAKYKAETWRIRCITDIFEPGSTFKIVPLLAALNDDIKNLDKVIDCENGKYNLFKETITDHEEYGELTFKDVIVNSSNIGVAKMAMELGPQNLYRAARDFGFGNRTGIELPGEITGILKKPAEWSGFSVAAISYGYEVAVTPLQMAMAYGAIVNGGLLLKPHIVREIKDEAEVIKKFKPEVIRRVMSPQIADSMKQILHEVVERGTGEKAAIDGLQIGGKTGTARKPYLDRAGYSNTRYVGSFAGFYPVEEAGILIYLIIDEPTPVHYGGQVAAPTFKKILRRVLEVYEPMKSHKEATKFLTDAKQQIPDLRGKPVTSATRMLKEADIRYQVTGEGPYVFQQQITGEADGPVEVILTVGNLPERSFAIMPDLTGFSLRKAVSELSRKKLQVKVYGSGAVFKQDPPAGTKIKTGAQCMLECRPVKTALIGL